MTDLKKIKSLLARSKGDLSKRFRVREIGVFGSYVRGEQKKTSDIDILVEFSKPVGIFKFLDLEEYLSGMLGAKVDLVSKKALKPAIGTRILDEVIYV